METLKLKVWDKKAVKYYTEKYSKELKTKKGVEARLKKENEKLCNILFSPKLTDLTISVKWNNNRTWGWCPSCEWSARYDDGSYKYGKSGGVTGCGYDKLSTLLARVFNETAKSLLYHKIRYSRKKMPYGVNKSNLNGCWFDGGIGVQCYTVGIAKYLGLNCESYRGKTEDFFKFSAKK